MDELKLELLTKHSKVLALEDLKDSDILDEFKYISIVEVFQGEKKFKSIDNLIHTLNLFFKYEVDLYEELLDFLISDYVLKLESNNVTSEKALHPVMLEIKKKLNSKGLNDYLFTGDTRQLQPFEIFRSVELLSTCVEHFQKEDFTSEVVSKGLSFLTTKEEMRKMFSHLEGYPFNVRYEDLMEESIDRDNSVFLDFLITEYDHEDKKDIKDIKLDKYTLLITPL